MDIQIFLPSDGKDHKLPWLLENGQKKLADAHEWQKKKKERPYCKCVGSADKANFVVKAHTDNKKLSSTTYHVARMPRTAHEHDIECEGYLEPPESSGAGEYRAAISVAGDMTQIKVSFSLKPGKTKISDNPALHITRDANSKTIQRAQMGLNALLCHMWDDAGLNNWRSGAIRSWSWAYSELGKVAESTLINSNKLKDVLFLQPEADRSWLPDEPIVVQNQPYFLVLFEVKHVRKYAQGGGLYFGLSHTKRTIFADQSVCDSLAKSYPRYWPNIHIEDQSPSGNSVPNSAKSDARIICLALCQWNKTMRNSIRLEIKEAALLQVNGLLIPVESSYELKVANKLTRELRYFSKPLRYDAKLDIVFPDFVLLDTKPDPFKLEVYGVSNNSAYDERKREKEKYYRENNIPYWSWTPKDQKEIPELPPKRDTK